MRKLIKICEMQKALIVLFFCGWALFFSLIISINLPTFHIDGAFQTASCLYRLAAGQFPGRDFFPYLGIGPVLLLYPLFKLFGSNLAASVISAQLMTVLLAWLSVSVIYKFVLKTKSFLNVLIAAGISIMILVEGFRFIPYHAISSAVNNYITPGTSLRTIRSALPYLVVLIYYFFILKVNSTRMKNILCGFATGIILLWSNDYAIITATLFAFLSIGHDFILGKFKISNIIVYIFFTVFSWFALLSLITVGHPLAMLKYDFLDVAKDQWYLFGPYSGSSRIFQLIQLPHLLMFGLNSLCLVVLGFSFIAALKTKRIEHALLVWIGIVLFAGGTVASFGGHIYIYYFLPFYYWAALTLTCTVLRLLYYWLMKIHKPIVHSLTWFESALLCIIFLTMLTVAAFEWHQYNVSVNEASHDKSRFYVPELGGYLDVQWKDYINLARRTNVSPVVEEYWGIWSATRRIFPNWPVNSVIHALGQIRDQAEKALKGAKIIISTRNQTSPAWQSWSLSQNFWFYNELFKNWTPYAVSPTTIVWHRSKKVHHYVLQKCYPGKEFKNINLTVKQAGFYRIKMKYKFLGAGRHLLFVQNNLSYALDADGYVSVDTNARVALFPAYIKKSGKTTLDIKVEGAGKYDFIIVSCDFGRIPLVDKNVLNVSK